MSKPKIILASLLLTTSFASAQMTAPAGSIPQPAVSNTNAQMTTPTPYGLTQSLGDLEQTAQGTVRDLERTRVDRWKVDGRDKDQARSNVESLQRNLTSALPALIQQVRSNPASLSAGVKLYRNLNAVYDVLASVSESAGAFGSKDDFNALARDTSNMDNVRHAIAEQLEQLATAQDAQLARLTNQVRTQQQAAATAAAAPPKRVIVDDNPAPKKAPAKKKAAKPAAAPPASSQ